MVLFFYQQIEADIDVMDINGNTPFHILLQSSTQVSTVGNKSAPDCESDSHYSIVILKLLVDYCKVCKLPNIMKL